MTHLQRFLLIFFSLLVGASKAQNVPINEPEMVYNNHYQFGFNLNSFGLGGIQFRYNWHQNAVKSSFFESEFCRIKHPKEIRRNGAITEQPNQYTFGKLNTVFFLRNGIGQTILLTERPYKNAISLRFNYSAGVNIALLKPVFLDIFYPYSVGSPSGYLVSEKYDPNKHTDIYKIYGNSSFFVGINEIDAQLGGYGRAGIEAEWGQFPDETKSLETGITFDTFISGIPMMAHLPYESKFIGFYLAFNWGFKN